MASIIVTRNFFTHDGKWCIVLATDGGNDFKVINEDGREVRTIRKGYLLLGWYPDGTAYYVTSEGNTYRDWYCVWDMMNSSANAVISADRKEVAMSPNPVKYEERVVVTLPQEVAAAGGKILVFDTTGRKLASTDFAAGIASVAIEGRNLAHGINLVNVISPEGDIIATGKLIRE